MKNGCIDLDGILSEIAELEKENAELKRDNEGYEKDNTRLINQFNQTSVQLTKAKDILRMIVYWKSDKKELLKFINKAEQFLNSEVDK
ncbi:MAG: hypothetical protein J6S85_11510 [Methanobrevibacter sp.]|nr:hypothetical protein [Methanobrevibacter sp.]